MLKSALVLYIPVTGSVSALFKQGPDNVERSYIPLNQPLSYIFQLLDVYLHRASKDLIISFIKLQGFHLLATQLHQFPASTEIAEACFTVMFGKPFHFSEQ